MHSDKSSSPPKRKPSPTKFFELEDYPQEIKVSPLSICKSSRGSLSFLLEHMSPIIKQSTKTLKIPNKKFRRKSQNCSPRGTKEPVLKGLCVKKI